MSKILVIIPTLNAQQTLGKLLCMLKEQDILVIDSSSTDDTLKIAKEQSVDVSIIKKYDFNHATTRNMALNYQADFYLFLTQDALPYDRYLIEKLLKTFEEDDVVVSYARQIPFQDADILEKFARETNYPDASVVKSKDSIKELGIKTFFSSNSCAMYRAGYFKKVSGFKEGLIANEDMEFAYRAIMDEKKVVYCKDAMVWHSHKYSLREIFKRYFIIGKFFKENQYILDAVDTESTGIKQAKKELNHLLKNRPLLIPKSILFSLTKYIAYKLGLKI